MGVPINCLQFVNRMYGGVEEGEVASTADKDKWADKLGKTALQSIKTEDKYEDRMGNAALGRIKRT